MKTGTISSIIGHTLIVTWGLFQLPGPKAFEVEAVDAMPVDLVPIADIRNINEGSKTAPKAETPSPAKITNPKPRPDSQKAGAAPTDQDAPVTDKTTDLAAIPEPTSEPSPPKVEAPKPPEAPEKPEPPAPVTDTPEPEHDPAPADPAKPAVKDTAELPATPEKPADEVKPVASNVQPRSKPKPPKPVESPTEEPAPDKPKKNAEPKKTDFDPDQVAALLNKVDASGGGGLSSDTDPSLGTRNPTNPTAAAMSQTELDALRAAIQACWNPPVGATSADALMVPIRMQLNIDGTLNGDPVALSIPGGDFGQVMAESALRAVRRCAPYDFLPPEKYETWNTVNINFDPRDMF